MKRRRRRRELRIGDWPFGPPGVDCRACLREPCTCRRDEVRFFPFVLRLVDDDGVLVEIGS